MTETNPSYPRKRGAQPGNQNARVHGFYSSAIAEAEREALSRAEALDVDSLDNEIDVLRVRLASVLRDNPERFDLLVLGTRTLAALVATRYRLSRRSERDLAGSLADVVRSFSDLMPDVEL